MQRHTATLTGLSAILNATVPLFGALIAWLWLKDRPTSSRVLGLVIGFAGVALLAWDKASFKPDASGVAPAWCSCRVVIRKTATISPASRWRPGGLTGCSKPWSAWASAPSASGWNGSRPPRAKSTPA